MFIQAYLESNGNGKQSAMKAYNTTPKNAGVIAHAVLQRPAVLSAMQRKFEKINSDWWNNPENIKKSIAYDAEKAKRENTRLRAKELLASTHGMFIERKVLDMHSINVIEFQHTLSEESVASLVSKLGDMLLNQAKIALPENKESEEPPQENE